MRKLDARGDTPVMDTDDELKVEAVSHSFRFSKYSDNSEITALIVEAVNRMGGAGEFAEEGYRVCIDRLCHKAKLVSNIIQVEYFDMPEDSYLDRWSLVMLAVELQHNSSSAFFEKILASEIPKENSKHPHSFSTVGEEVMIRTTAIEGLERMATNDDKEAIKVLFHNIGHEVFSIRRAATQAILAIGDEDMYKKLINELPKRHNDLLKICRTDVREAEQAEGGLFVKNRDDADTPVPQEDRSGNKSGC